MSSDQQNIIVKRKRKLDPSIIRVGDCVRIVIPEAFDRVGYPLTKKMIIDEMTGEQLQALNTVLYKTFGVVLEMTDKIALNKKPVTDKILDIIASRILCNRGWGGKDRKIYTTHIPDDCIGQLCTVWSRKTVKNGLQVKGNRLMFPLNRFVLENVEIDSNKLDEHTIKKIVDWQGDSTYCYIQVETPKYIQDQIDKYKDKIDKEKKAREIRKKEKQLAKAKKLLKSAGVTEELL